MRTTLTLDDALAKDLKQLAVETGRSFKETINAVLARGLAIETSGQNPVQTYKLEPVSLGAVREGVNLDKALSLATALEDEQWARKLELGK
jgi:hypothetical protein